jgi:hypothetical protein
MSTYRDIEGVGRPVRGGDDARVIDVPYRLVDERMVERAAPAAGERQSFLSGLLSFLFVLAVLPLKFVLMLVRMALGAAMVLGIVACVGFLALYFVIEVDSCLRWAAGSGIAAFTGYVGAIVVTLLDARLDRAAGI